MRIYTFLLLILVAAACSGESERSDRPSGARGMEMEDIDRAPIIKQAVFSDLDGNEVSLEDYRGKVLVIDFWETWCGPCLQVFPALQDLREEYPDEFDVLAVTLGMMEGPEEAREFREEHGYDFQFLYDSNDVSEQLGIYSIPFKMYIDPEGELIKSEIGSRGREGDYESARTVIEEYFE